MTCGTCTKPTRELKQVLAFGEAGSIMGALFMVVAVLGAIAASFVIYGAASADGLAAGFGIMYGVSLFAGVLVVAFLGAVCRMRQGPFMCQACRIVLT